MHTQVQAPVKTQTVKMICLYCRQPPKNHQEVMEINYFGYHLTCDHVMADVNDQRKADNEL